MQTNDTNNEKQGLDFNIFYQNQYPIDTSLNENFLKIKTFAATLSVESKIKSSAITEDNMQKLFLIEKNEDKEFAKKENQIAYYNQNLGWLYYMPKAGDILYLKDAAKFMYFDNTSWQELSGAITGNTNLNDNIDQRIQDLMKNNKDNSNINLNNVLNVANNLGDLQDKETARINLDVYSRSQTFCKEKCFAETPDQDLACKNIGSLRAWQIRRVGDYKITAQTSDHDNWYICNGRELSRNEYSDLYEVLKGRCGNGNGSTTFNLPDFTKESIFGNQGVVHVFILVKKDR